MESLLSIIEKSEEIHIDEEKLRFIATKVAVWDYFGTTRSQYISLNSKMLKGCYKNKMPLYFGDGKKSIFLLFRLRLV